MGKRALEHDLRCLKQIGDDRVPMLHCWTGTEVFAAAFGSPVEYPEHSMPFAMPAVGGADDADRLEEPDIYSGSLGAIFQLADRMVALCGPGYPVRICDVQSPFDIAALIRDKEAFLPCSSPALPWGSSSTWSSSGSALRAPGPTRASSSAWAPRTWRKRAHC